MEEYVKLFIDESYPNFIDKYLTTETLKRIKHVSQFCGCDYTNLYSPLFFYTRFDHSRVVALMTWHFTHDKKATIAALLHDVGTPCFAHCIDYVFGDYMKQETSEKSINEMIQTDTVLLQYLKEDGIEEQDLEDLKKYPILENTAPKLCTDRLDGVLHTCYIWLHTHTLVEVKEVYNNVTVLINEEGKQELGFKDKKIAEKFVEMTATYAKELQGNTDKYVMKYVSEVVKDAFYENLICLDDLYTKKEEEIVSIFANNFYSWKEFRSANHLIGTEEEPSNFYISFATKKRNVIPLLQTDEGDKRINTVSESSKEIYSMLEEYQDTKYAYVDGIKHI